MTEALKSQTSIREALGAIDCCTRLIALDLGGDAVWSPRSLNSTAFS